MSRRQVMRARHADGRIKRQPRSELLSPTESRRLLDLARRFERPLLGNQSWKTVHRGQARCEPARGGKTLGRPGGGIFESLSRSERTKVNDPR